MTYQQTPYTGISLLAGFGLLLLTAYLLRRYRSRSTQPVVWALAGITGFSGLWSVVTGLELASVSLEAKIAWATISFVGMLVPPTWVVFALLYTDRDRWVTRRNLAMLYAPPVFVVVLAVLFGPDGTVWESAERAFNGSFYVLVVRNEPWVNPVVVYLYLLLVAGMVILYQWLYRSGGVYRGQAATLIIGSVAPTAVNLLMETSVSPHPEVNLTPLGFVVTGFTFTYALVRYRLLDVVPVGRASVIENMRDGYLVVDDDGRVVDLNPAARAVVHADAPLGEPLESVLPECYPLSDIDCDDAGVLCSFETDTVDGGRYIDVRPSTVRGGDGRLLLLQDVTERRERERELERANDQLEQFAGVVSHDLRNPLNVARGRLELARAESDSEHLETADSALDRMETIVDDTLQLARMGRVVGDPEWVDLDAAVERSWANVATAEADLRTRELPAIGADPDRVVRVLENLYRNAIEHGGPDVTVRVGPLEDGFYLEDDGPGIPADERENVLEFGYSNGDGGTGFGLAIVAQIAAAHDWEIRVTDGADGGARFEFTGVGQTAKRRAE